MLRTQKCPRAILAKLVWNSSLAISCGTESDFYLAGTVNGGEGEKVPNITPDGETGIGDWSEGDIVSFMKDGMKPDFDNVQGSMEEVINHSTSKLTEDDLAAIAVYLKSIPPINNKIQ